MSLKVNGQAYDWGDVDTKMPGLILVCQSIDYSDELEAEEAYGKGHMPRGFGNGNYKADAKLSLLRDDFDDVVEYCKAKGIPFYKLKIPVLTVSYANDGGRTIIDELKNVICTKRSYKAAQGDKSLMVDLELKVLGGIIADGVKPV